MNAPYVRILLRVLLLTLWTPTIAVAAVALTLQETLSSVTGLVLIVVIALSTLAGATALVIRIDRELRDKPGAVFERPTLFAVAHMLGSWLAGALAFILAESQNMNDWGELGFIITASFMGAKFIELVAEKYLIKTLPPETKDAP